MSDTAQGPGWWLASDGKWYPPQAPPPVPPPIPPPPSYQPPGGYQPQAPKKSGKGCLIAVLVLVGLFALSGIALAVAGTIFAKKVGDGAFGGGPCPFLSDDEASDVMGDGTTVIEMRGLTSVLRVIDDRVLSDDPSCALTREDTAVGEEENAALGRIVRYRGADARQKYDLELKTARGISEDRGNGITVTTDDYFNKEVTGIGDQAFCTKSSGLGAGVLVRDGNTLVYVSVVENVGAAPGVDLGDGDNPKLGTDDSNCELAQELARKVL